MMKLWIFVAIALISFVAAYPFSEKDDELGAHTDDSSAVIDDVDLSDEEKWMAADGEAGSHNVNPFRLYRGQNHFTLSMLKTITKGNSEKNQIFSPHSTYRSLLLAYFGAEGSVQKTLEESMYMFWAEDKNAVVDAYKAESEAKIERFMDHGVQFNSVDRLYVSQETELKPYITELFTNSIKKVDFTDAETRRQEINAWVEEVTQNHIKDLLPMNSILPSTKAVLTNAAFFKGLWATKFDKHNTQTKTFNCATPADVEMMTVKSKFTYGVLEKEHAAYLELPYEGEDQAITMFIYLPLENTPTAVDDLLEKMSPETIQEASKGKIPQDVDVQLPKMSLEGSYELNNVLANMGIDNLFGVPLTGFSDDTPVSFDDMMHKAKIEIDEEGSVAAAATATMSRSMSFMKPEPVNFHCDHPFVFMINDRVTQEVLFAGVYRGPNN